MELKSTSMWQVSSFVSTEDLFFGGMRRLDNDIDSIRTL